MKKLSLNTPTKCGIQHTLPRPAKNSPIYGRTPDCESSLQVSSDLPPVEWNLPKIRELEKGEKIYIIKKSMRTRV